MGGGLELALACHYRIGMATDRSVFSFPEVRLGLLPGAGGTQRFPRIVPLPVALDMMLSGRTIGSKKAKEIGILDVLLDPIVHVCCYHLILACNKWLSCMVTSTYVG